MPVKGTDPETFRADKAGPGTGSDNRYFYSFWEKLKKRK